MTLVRWMAGGCVLSWLATVALDATAAREVLFGMLGPLGAAVGSWVLAERTFLAQPDRLTALMVTAFAAKMVFFGAYVAIMLNVVDLRPVPFVASFTAYFIALHAVEAFGLRRLFAGGMDATR